MKTPLEVYVEEKIEEIEKTTTMQKELNKYGKRTACGGTVWTVSDMARFFLDQKKKRK